MSFVVLFLFFLLSRVYDSKFQSFPSDSAWCSQLSYDRILFQFILIIVPRLGRLKFIDADGLSASPSSAVWQFDGIGSSSDKTIDSIHQTQDRVQDLSRKKQRSAFMNSFFELERTYSLSWFAAFYFEQYRVALDILEGIKDRIKHIAALQAEIQALELELIVSFLAGHDVLELIECILSWSPVIGSSDIIMDSRSIDPF